MTTRALHPKPHPERIVPEQIRAVGLAMRTEMMLFALFLLFAGAAMLWQQARHGTPLGFDLIPAVASPLIFVALLAPLSVWKDEAPGRRTYHLSMPVDRSWHQLVKNSSGWIWLMATVAVYLLWAWLVATLTGGDLGVESHGIGTHVQGGRVPEEVMRALMADLAHQRLSVPAWQWLVPFVAATVAYLLGSIVVLASDHPLRWAAGIIGGFMLTMTFLDAIDMEPVMSIVETVFDGRYGLGTLISGETRHVLRTASHGSATIRFWTELPDPGAWLVTVALWLGVAVVGVVIAATRHRNA